jgi:hypothetical protein
VEKCAGVSTYVTGIVLELARVYYRTCVVVACAGVSTGVGSGEGPPCDMGECAGMSTGEVGRMSFLYYWLLVIVLRLARVRSDGCPSYIIGDCAGVSTGVGSDGCPSYIIGYW